MGRRSHSRALGVWANGLRVGRWLVPTRGPMEFCYDAAWVASQHARPLSLSLPINLDGFLSAWPIAGPRHNQVHPKKLKLAMAVRDKSKHYRIAEIERRHFNATARQCGFGADMESIIDDVLAKTNPAIERVGASLPRGFPEAIFASVTLGLKKSARQMAAR